LGELALEVVNEFSHFTAIKTGDNDSFWLEFSGYLPNDLRSNQAGSPKDKDTLIMVHKLFSAIDSS
jgi:hypothetical protein